jgi:hypothetical protein
MVWPAGGVHLFFADARLLACRRSAVLDCEQMKSPPLPHARAHSHCGRLPMRGAFV